MSAEPTECDTIAELFAALESPLLAYALRLTGDLGVAEDVLQDAFMKLHAQFDEVREPRRWLYRTVHNLALNHLRDANKIVPLDVGGAEGGADIAADTGYFDQAHLAREFRSFTAMTPTQYTRQRIVLPSHVPVQRHKNPRPAPPARP